MDLLTQLQNVFALGAPAPGMDWFIPTFQGNFYPWLQNFQTVTMPGYYGTSPQQFSQGAALGGGYAGDMQSGTDFFQIPSSLFQQPIPSPPVIQSTFDPTRAQVTEAIYSAPVAAPAYQTSAPAYQPPPPSIYQPPPPPAYQPPPQLPPPPVLPTIQSDLPTPRKDVNQSSVPGYQPSFDYGYGINPFSLLRPMWGGQQ